MRSFHLVLVILAVLCSCSRSGETGLNPGDFPPAFELKDLEGNIHSLSEFKGKVVLINFWATWCAPCVQELPALQDLYLKLKDKGFVILSVGGDDPPESFANFQKQFSLTYPILYDLKGSVKKAYKVQGYPESFLIDKSGQLIMFPDLQSGVPSVRIVGPRNWSSKGILELINQLLDSN